MAARTSPVLAAGVDFKEQRVRRTVHGALCRGRGRLARARAQGGAVQGLNRQVLQALRSFGEERALQIREILHSQLRCTSNGGRIGFNSKVRAIWKRRRLPAEEHSNRWFDKQSMHEYQTLP